MKFGHSIEHKVRNIFFKKKQAEKQKVSYKVVKLVVLSTLISISFDSPSLGHTIKTNRMKVQTGDPEMLNFDLKKESVTNFSTTFCA